MALAAGSNVFLAGAIGCFSLVLSRFRIHQRAFKGFSTTPIWRSASTLTQTLVTLEGMALFGMALVFSGTLVKWAVGISAVAGISVIIATEVAVRRAKVGTKLAS